MKISKGTSLYFLAKLGWLQRENTNLCTVFWCCLWGLCIAAGIVGVSTAFGFLLIVAPVMGIVSYFLNGVPLIDEALVGSIIDSVIITGTLIGWAVCAWQEKREEDPEYYEKRAERRIQREQNPGLLRVAYRSWKQKTCVLIKFEDAK